MDISEKDRIEIIEEYKKVQMKKKNKFKLIVLIIFLSSFCLMTLYTKFILNHEKSYAANTGIPIVIQEKIYQVIKKTETEINREASARYPSPIASADKRKFISYYNRKAALSIEKHYDLTQEEYGRIYLNGLNKQW